jgi:hypothetical protein
VHNIPVFFQIRRWPIFVLEYFPQGFPLCFLVGGMTMIIIREPFAPILAWSRSIADKTVALHLEKSNEIMLQKLNLLLCYYYHFN